MIQSSLNKFSLDHLDNSYVILNVNSINEWLGENQDLYIKINRSKELWKNKGGLPNEIKITVEDKFLKIYQELSKLSKYHRLENYLKTQVLEYSKCNKSEKRLSEWISYNETLWLKNYSDFTIEYLDYDKCENKKHLLIYIPFLKEFNIYVDSRDFKNTISFIHIFENMN